MINTLHNQLNYPDESYHIGIANEYEVTEEMNNSLIELKWLKLQLERISQQLNQINLVLDQLQTIEYLEYNTVLALIDTITDLKKVYHTIDGPWTTWVNEGLPVIEDWVKQINQIRYCEPLSLPGNSEIAR